MNQAVTVYDAVGGDQSGEAYFRALVDDFYDRVEADELLRPLYPSDLGPSRHHTALFLMQYWGGPPTYSAQRGHPRLRLRHAPFPIAMAERNAWLRHMIAAVAASEAPPEVKQLLDRYFEQASTAMINQPL